MSAKDNQPLDDFHDKVATQIDSRKLQKLVDEGVISLDELANAPIIYLEQACTCEDVQPNEHNRCPKCLTKYSEKDVTDE